MLDIDSFQQNIIILFDFFVDRGLKSFMSNFKTKIQLNSRKTLSRTLSFS